MYLYDKKNNYFDVYAMSPKVMEIFDYRKNEMKIIPEKRQILEAYEWSQDFQDARVLEKFSRKFNKDSIALEDLLVRSDTLLRFLKAKEEGNEDLLNAYFSGIYDGSNVARIQDLTRMRYFLLTLKRYEKAPNDDRCAAMKNIIELPNTLYYLQMLIQGHFEMLDGVNIRREIELFQIDKIDELSFETLRKTDRCGITLEALDETNKKAVNDAKVLRYIRR